MTGVDEKRLGQYCAACSMELFGEDRGDFAGLVSEEDWAKGRAANVVCRGCGATLVDPGGNCVANDCAKAGQPGHGLEQRIP